VAPSAPDAASAPSPPPDVEGHLPVTVRPEHYRVALRVDPAKDRFSAVASIDVSVPAPTSFVVLHGRDLHLTRVEAALTTARIPATATPRAEAGATHPEEIVLAFAQPLPAGSATIAIEYDAPFAPDLAGLYRVEEGGKAYAYSQFEATDARRAIPCFDEPQYKTPFEITVAAPRSTMALSNTPEVGSDEGPDGMVVHRFSPTPPLPTYLVALAVGDFDVAEAKGSPLLPIRVVTTKGHSGETASALEGAAALVSKLSEYFDMPYPFAKLDLVAVPELAAGAMENPGLVTFRSTLLLQTEATSTWLRRMQAITIAHELAHQWFGDLVTMRWWDDLWLNEGFATWAEAMAVDAWKPSFAATRDQIAGLGHVMDADGLRSSRAVRQPVSSSIDADASFDDLTYDKGAAVLRMVERWLGPDTFRRGVQRYLRENAWKTARADDLFRALDYVSGARVEPFASAFLDHPGVPQVFARMSCAGGKSTLELRQGTWRPLGEPEPATSTTWTLPVCVTGEGRKGEACFTLGTEPIVRQLGQGCPGWFHPNASQSGYYRFVLDSASMLALARAGRSLDPLQRTGVVSNAWAAVRAGTMDPSGLLDVLRAFDGETNRLVLDEVVTALRHVDDVLVDDAVRDRYRRFVAARLGPRKRALGWAASSGEDDDRRLERQTVLSAMGEMAGDEATLAEAEGFARKWLSDPASVPSDVAGVAVPMASLRAGKERLAELRAVLARADSAPVRITALRAMGSFDDPAVLFDAFDAALSEPVKLSEMRHVFGAALDHRRGRPALYAWVKSHWAKLDARMPGSFGRPQLVQVTASMCSAAERDDAKAFFTEATKSFDGLNRGLDEALETSGLCIALHDHGAADVSRYLMKQPSIGGARAGVRADP
jgi:alanyl aminopeptidase